MKFIKRAACDLRGCFTLCVLLLVALVLFRDPFLIIWWPQEPVQVGNVSLFSIYQSLCAILKKHLHESPLLSVDSVQSPHCSHLLSVLQKPMESDGLPLDMATDSIDDMYSGCQSKAADTIHLFGVFEWHVNVNWTYAWASAERKAKKPAHKNLNADHATVLYMYANYKFQEDFDRAVRTGKHKYSTFQFKYHYFYFHLTDAIRVLRQNQTSCRTTYRRTRTYFERDVIDKEMRFGAFTLTASSQRSFDFNGNVSCFEIYTCFGAEVTYYSAEDQTGLVLIPPYEVFTITHILTNQEWCSVVYKLQSTKTPRSDLNCKLDSSELEKLFGPASEWHVSRVTIAACVILLIITSLVLIKRKQRGFVVAVLGALLLLLFFAALCRMSQWISEG